ncbi:MAG: hypothetical protein ACKO40_00600, partial [Planctomycetaceae bacterium]
MALAISLAWFVASARGEDPAPAPSFEPGDISIGEPIALPFAKPGEARGCTAAVSLWSDSLLVFLET